MWIKNYTASSVREALTKIKLEMGTSAVILDTRVENGLTPRSGGSGAQVTVTAASEHPEGTIPDVPADRALSMVEEGPKTLRLRGVLAESPENDAAPEPVDQQDANDLPSRVAGLERTVRSLANAADRQPVSRSLDDWLQGATMQQWLANERQLQTDLAGAYTGYLLDQMPDPDPFLAHDRLPSSVCFIGPSGSGKSTMLMKALALCWRTRKGSLPVVEIAGDVSLSNGRLATWAEMFDLNFTRFAFSEIGRLSRHLSEINEESVFVKCALPTKDEGGERTVKRIARALNGRVVVLVLSALVRRADNERFIERFAAFSPTHLCFTHWDETQPHDDARYLSAVSRLPLAYYALGGAPCGELEPFTNTELRAGIADELIGSRGANRTINLVETGQ